MMNRKVSEMIVNNHKLPKIEGKYVSLREVTIEDAEFILSLRTSEKGRKFLHQTDPDVSKQVDYIKRYLARNDEWYFIVEDERGESIGCLGIYDVTDQSATTGRWIMKDTKDPRLAIECKLLICDYVYYTLGIPNVHGDTMETNTSILNLYKLFGYEEIGRRDGIVYFNMSQASYEKKKNLIARFCK